MSPRVIGLLNALVWPALSRLALPLTVLTLGLVGPILNGLLVSLRTMPGFVPLLPSRESGKLGFRC